MKKFITKGIVYCFENILDGKKYIGKTINEKERLLRHKKEVRYCKRNSYFYNAVRKYGWENFSYIILCDVQLQNKKLTDVILQLKEIEFIKRYKANTEGYNMTIGGDGAVGHIASLETRLKMSLLRKGKKAPEGRKLSEQAKKVLKYSSEGELLEEFSSIGAAARNVNTTKQQVASCCHRLKNKTRGFVFRFKDDPDFYTVKPKTIWKIGDRTGENNPHSKLNKASIVEIRAKYQTKQYTQKQLALEYGITQSHISYIILEKNWK